MAYTCRGVQENTDCAHTLLLIVCEQAGACSDLDGTSPEAHLYIYLFEVVALFS